MRWTIADVPVMADEEASETVVVLAHGAGSHMEHRTLEWLSGLVRDAGASVVRFNFAYRAQGRSLPDRMPALMGTYRSVTESVRERRSPRRLIIGGHSMGGRVASMIESEDRHADGLLLFGYPLHPPKQLDKLRDAHLALIRTPTLQINGTEDELCTYALMESVRARLDPKIWTLHWIEGADHSYGVKKGSGRMKQDVEAELLGALAGWLRT